MNIEEMTTRAAFQAFGNDQPATYNGRDFTAEHINNVLDCDYEVYEDNEQLPRRVTMLAIMVSDVSESVRGDTVLRSGKTWTVNDILEDDGYERRLEVV